MQSIKMTNFQELGGVGTHQFWPQHPTADGWRAALGSDFTPEEKVLKQIWTSQPGSSRRHQESLVLSERQRAGFLGSHSWLSVQEVFLEPLQPSPVYRSRDVCQWGCLQGAEVGFVLFSCVPAFWAGKSPFNSFLCSHLLSADVKVRNRVCLLPHPTLRSWNWSFSLSASSRQVCFPATPSLVSFCSLHNFTLLNTLGIFFWFLS